MIAGWTADPNPPPAPTTRTRTRSRGPDTGHTVERAGWAWQTRPGRCTRLHPVRPGPALRVKAKRDAPRYFGLLGIIVRRRGCIPATAAERRAAAEHGWGAVPGSMPMHAHACLLCASPPAGEAHYSRAGGWGRRREKRILAHGSLRNFGKNQALRSLTVYITPSALFCRFVCTVISSDPNGSLCTP